MVAPRQLSRPPISEALVDIRIESDQSINRERLEPLRVALAQTFPVVEERNLQQAEFRIEGGRMNPPLTQDLGFHGVWLKAQDGRRIAQFRTDGFTLNNIGGYIGGDALLEESLALWNRYAAVVKPNRVTRLALRYINRLTLPLTEGDSFDRFLAAPAQLPREAPQNVSSFLSRVVAHEANATAVVTQKLDAGPEAAVPVVLDIDVFYAGELPADVAVLKERLDHLRTLKNRTFFSLLTEASVSLYL